MAERVVLGRISGHFGIRGWVKVDSYTRPAGQIMDYDRFLAGRTESPAGWAELKLEDSTGDSGKIRLKFFGIDNREDSDDLIGSELGIDASQLEKLEPGEYYWKDLVGLTVRNTRNEVLGTVVRMLETGANDVVVVGCEDRVEQTELLVPWIPGVIEKVDLSEGLLLVDWESELLPA